MAKNPSEPDSNVSKPQKNPKWDTKHPSHVSKSQKSRKWDMKPPENAPFSAFRTSFKKSRNGIWERKLHYPILHRPFRRSYREEYERPLEVPGLLHHAASAFKLLFKNWKVFLPLIILIVVLNVVFVGLMSEDTYVNFQDTLDESSENLASGNLGQVAKASMLLISTVTTGGLSQGLSEVQQIFAVIFFLITWLVTIYLARHFLAGHKPKLRDGLYNALTPLISTFVVFLVALIQLIPVLIVIIAYSTAVATDFLSTPFYALIFFIFAALLILLSAYLIAGTFFALIAVTAPGLYPVAAIRTAANLVAGRRLKLLVRMVFLFLVLAVIWIVVMLPLILLDLWLKSFIPALEGIPFVSLELLIMTVFSVVYFAIYSYLYYRRVLEYDD